MSWVAGVARVGMVMKKRYQIKVLKAFCKGCELCLTVCHKQALKLSPDVNAGGFHFPEPDQQACIGCRKCALICPEAALEIFKLTEKK